MIVIYRITNKANGKTYIGQHKIKSVLTDDDYMGSGKIIKMAIRKYGKESFQKEYINVAMTQFEANVLEKYYIAKENPEYNISPGGNGGKVWKGGNPFKGHKHTLEAKRAIGNKSRGRCSGDKNPSKRPDVIAKIVAKNKKPVMCIEENLVFDSVKSASEYYGIQKSKISECCNGTRKTAGGFHWEFV